MVSIKIMGTPSRMENIEQLMETLNLTDEDVFIDYDLNGVLWNASRAWLAPLQEGETHRLVLQDDVELCDDFVSIVDKIVNTHPNACISLFPLDSELKVLNVDDNVVYYKTLLASGCGLILPVEYIEECFVWANVERDSQAPDDDTISAYCNKKGIPILTTIPSTIQHIGDISIANSGAPVRRTAFFKKDLSDMDWENATVLDLPLENFFVKVFQDVSELSNEPAEVTSKAPKLTVPSYEDLLKFWEEKVNENIN